MNELAYISALERSDLKRYPVGITKIPHRGAAMPAAPDSASSFSEVAAEVAAEPKNEPDVAPPASEAKFSKPFALWQDGDFGFGDVLDVINPLHHIPIVATLYRNMTGDKIGAVARIIGGALWGRIGGFVAGVVNAIVDWFTGKDIGDHIYAALFGKTSDAENKSQIIQAAKPTDNRAAMESPRAADLWQPAKEETQPVSSFANEEPFAELIGYRHEPPVHAQPNFSDSNHPKRPMSLSALYSYGRNLAPEGFAANSKIDNIA